MNSDIKTSPINKLRSHIMATMYRYEALDEEREGEDHLDTNSRWKTKKSSRLYCILLSILVIVVVIMTSFIIWQQLTEKDTCLTPQCIENGASLLANMNLSMDPCTDFYEYACGGWIEKAVIPPEKSSLNMFTTTNDNNEVIIQQLLSEENGKLNSKAVKKIKLFYKNCMDTEKIDELAISPVLKLIKELGSWTVTSDDESGHWNIESWDLTTAIAATSSYGVVSLFAMTVDQDDKDNTVNILEVQQGGLTLSNRDEYLKNETKYKDGFLKYAVQNGELLGGNDAVKEKMTDVYEFEKKLAGIFVPKEELIDREKTYNQMTVDDLQNMLNNQIDIKRYLQLSTQEIFLSTTKILVKTPEYFRKLALLLADTKKEILANYVVWSMIQLIPGYLPAAFTNAALQLTHIESGIVDIAPRWQRCIIKVNSQLGFVTSAMYVDRHFSKESRTEVEEILNNVKQALIDDLEVIKWMDKETAGKAIEKAYSVDNMIGFPDWIQQPDKLDEYYENLTILEDQFLMNHLACRKFLHLKSTVKLHEKPDPNEWGMYPHVVNAYYSPINNNIVFPAGILQPPFYEPRMPKSVKYGSIGMIIGHELTHGFDNTGRKYDQQGRLNNWWSEESAKNFVEKSNCMEHQYSQYRIYGKNLNGKYTLSENIADNGGVKFAFSAFQSIGTSDQQVPGLDLSPEQLFFLGFAQAWCSKSRPQSLKMSILTDVHSIKTFRILGTVSNSPAFSSAFNCPENSPMNPQKKCSVW